MKYLCLLLSLISFASVLQAQTLSVSQSQLSNGLKIVVIEDHRAPVVTHMLWYKVGAAEDPPGKSGLAHYLEHLMFKGTEKLGVGDFSRIVSENGGNDNAFTSHDYTGYFQRIAADRLDLVMGMEADRMVNLKIPDTEYEPERAVVLSERNQRTDSNPNAIFAEQRRSVSFFNHPYGRPIVGYRAEIESITPDDVMTFYRAYYAPNNAILVVAGDVMPEEVFALAKKHFGDLPPNPNIQSRQRAHEPERRLAARLTFEDPKISQPYLMRNYPAPHRKAGDQKEAAAATLLAEVLGGSSVTSVLSKTLTIEADIALGVGAWHDDQTLDPQSFTIYLAPKDGVSFEEAERALDDALSGFFEQGIDPEQLERIRTQVRTQEIYALDDQQGLARRYGTALTQGLTVEDVANWTDILMNVSEEEIMNVAKKIFDPKVVVTSYASGGAS